MANSLIKEKKYIPGRAGQKYQAARPARDGYEMREVCGYQTVKKDLIPGYYKAVTDPRTGQTSMVYIPSKPSGGGITSETSSEYVCRMVEVAVSTPAEKGQPYIAATKAGWDYLLGWDAGARSAQFLAGDGDARFSARVSIVGAICGLSSWTGALRFTGESVAFGFYVAAGMAKVMEHGKFKTAAFRYTSNTVFKVQREGDEVAYWMDDVLVYTSSALITDSALWMHAVMYSGDDEILNPAINQVSPLDTTTVVEGALTLRLPPTAVAGRKGLGAVLRARLPSPVANLQSGALSAPSFALLSLSIPASLPSMLGLVGAVGRVNLNLPAPRLAVSDRQTARLRLTLPLPDVYGRSWPYDQLPGVGGRIVLVGKSSVTAVATLPSKPMKAELGGVATAYGEATLATVTLSGLLSGAINPVAEVTLAAAPFVGVLSGSASILSGLNEVFVMNNTAGNPGGTTRYEDYPFNSFAVINGRSYGASAEGLFALDGDTDAGKPISASFGFGQMDFGTPKIKTASYCYLGASAGAMRLQLDALLHGSPASFTYPARGHGTTMREVRFDLGRGLRSTYLMPTFYNACGDDFEVDSVRFLINESARNI